MPEPWKPLKASAWKPGKQSSCRGKQITQSKDLTRALESDRAWYLYGLWKKFTGFGVNVLMVTVIICLFGLGLIGIYVVGHAIYVRDFEFLTAILAKGWQTASAGAVLLVIGQGILKKKG